MKNIVIINPIAGNKGNTRHIKSIEKIFKDYNLECNIYITEYAGHATLIAKECASKEKCRIYSIGGDGTLNEIVNGMAYSDSELVVIPAGTGNDFFKMVSSYNSLRKILITSFKKEAEPMDLIKIGKRYCINITSLGFDALVGKNVDIFRRFKFLPGKAKYNLSIIYTLFSTFNFKFKINLNKNVFKGKYTLAVISNGRYYGGGICPTPNADIQDGLMDICIVNSTNLIDKIRFLPKFKKGKHADIDICNFFKTEDIKIVSTRFFPINIDGEILMTTKIHARICKNALNIVKTIK